MSNADYWAECISEAADHAGANLTEKQITEIAEAVSVSHDNYGMAFYSPPASDRYNQIEREWEAKYKALEAEFDRYRTNAETAVKKALYQHPDANVGIGEYGEVRRYDGRSDRIQ